LRGSRQGWDNNPLGNPSANGRAAHWENRIVAEHSTIPPLWAIGGVGFLLVAAILISFFLPASSPKTILAPAYRIVDLSELGGKKTKVCGFNGVGDLVGEFDQPKGKKGAFLWNSEEGFTELGGFGGSQSRAYSVDKNRQVVGHSQSPDNHKRAFIWDPERGLREIGDLGGETSDAFSFTPFGGVLGESATDGTSGVRAYLWTEEAGMKNLGSLGGDFSTANVMNEKGEAVGTSLLKDRAQTHGFIWTATSGLEDLGSLLPEFASTANGINNHRVVVGSAELDKNETHAVLWDASGEIHDLGTLGGTVSQGYTLNDSMMVVGWSETHEGFQNHVFLRAAELWGDLTGHRLLEKTPHAFLYDWKSKQGIDLNDRIDTESGWVLLRALGIDPEGRILADGFHQGTLRTCFLIPESGAR
ncbi:MAG: hypothetical protein KC931_17860, partial [Candidatus Omnitrophica bacterium]|nr:hypothetical protein [Candidatus Omnitrophota bacterium]